MSLVEQAIARMRNQAAATKVAADATSVAAVPPAAPAVATRVVDAGKPLKRITLDRAVLRAEGYLAEENRERHFADHFRRIKRPLIEKALSQGESAERRVVMITSALPGEGKTFSSINLALSMSLERDVSVLLVDCDVAKRHISDILGLGKDLGLLDALADESVDIGSLVVETGVPGFSVLPAGRRVETMAELLSSNRMKQLMGELCRHDPRRIVLLDSPPLLITNEGRALVKFAGQVVLVVRAGRTPQHAVQDAVALTGAHQAGGIILNEAGGGGADGYYGYGTYGYGIGVDDV